MNVRITMSSINTDTGDTVLTSASTELKQMDSKPTDVSQSTTIAVNHGPREALITTAVNFLQNAKVRHTTLLQKQQFLKSKGFTGEEIQIAFERAGVFSQDPNRPLVINTEINSNPHSQLSVQTRQSAFGRIQEVLHSVALLSGLTYALYMFWKEYVKPFLFGRKKRTFDEALDDINKKVDVRVNEINVELAQAKDKIMQHQWEQFQQINREISIFRKDLDAIKGLLLNKNQFASPLPNTIPPSIPAWQLNTSTAHRHHRNSQSDNEKHDDVGSGSGSSETEVVTKNSDSSLEIM